MNLYDNLNQMMNYIEEHLEEELDTSKLASMIGVNAYTLQRLFPILTNVTLSEYIRKRRLSQAAKDLVQKNAKVIDIAIKYGYDSATSFSRAFMRFHGVKPSEVKGKDNHLKVYPKLEFHMPNIKNEMEYEIIELNELTLYGFGVTTDFKKIKKDAPNLFQRVLKEYPLLPHPDYGMVVYEDRLRSTICEYWVLWREKYFDFEVKTLPKSRWLKFQIPSNSAYDIQEMSDLFYMSFLPSCHYNLRELPELEYYHDGVTDFLIPIV